MPQPCCGPRPRVRSIKRSRVPWGRSIRWSTFASLLLLQGSLHYLLSKCKGTGVLAWEEEPSPDDSRNGVGVIERAPPPRGNLPDTTSSERRSRNVPAVKSPPRDSTRPLVARGINSDDLPDFDNVRRRLLLLQAFQPPRKSPGDHLFMPNSISSTVSRLCRRLGLPKGASLHVRQTATRASCWPMAWTSRPSPLASATHLFARPPTSIATRCAARTTRPRSAGTTSCSARRRGEIQGCKLMHHGEDRRTEAGLRYLVRLIWSSSLAAKPSLSPHMFRTKRPARSSILFLLSLVLHHLLKAVHGRLQLLGIPNTITEY
jgi:hypothetical protein